MKSLLVSKENFSKAAGFLNNPVIEIISVSVQNGKAVYNVDMPDFVEIPTYMSIV